MFQTVLTSQSQTVEVQPDEEVTLRCSNISRVITYTLWSRIDVKRNKIRAPPLCTGLVVMDFKTENLTWAPTSPFLRAFLSFVHFIDRAEQCSSLIIELACLIITALTAVLVVMIVDLLVKIFILQTDQVNQTSDRTIANVFFRQKVNEPLPWPYCVLLVIKQLVIGSLLCIRDTQFHQASVFPMTEFWRLCLADLQRAVLDDGAFCDCAILAKECPEFFLICLLGHISHKNIFTIVKYLNKKRL